MSEPAMPNEQFGKHRETLPEQLPNNPFPIFQSWFDHAVADKVQPNPNAMYVSTIDADGTPSTRTVLCKLIHPDPGAIVFFTNYNSRKGRAIGANPIVSVLFHWDTLDRQVRIEGPVVKSPSEESDAYFASRRWESRVGAWASDQSQPIESHDALMLKVFSTVEELGLDAAALVKEGPDAQVEIARPPFWGGYRVYPRSMELWCASDTRLHDRARWTRELTASDDGFDCGEWSATRLQP
jgi:pyridoxamine 5'-phosphate oxidase